MQLKDIQNFIDEKLKDEGSDTIKYSDISEEVKKLAENNKIDKETGNLIAQVFKRIADDENSHKVLLEAIQLVLDKEGKESNE